MKQNILALAVLLAFSTPHSVFAKGGEAPIDSPPSRYAHLDPQRYVPRDALNAAIDYFDSHLSLIANQQYMTVIDFSSHSGRERFFLINMSTGAVERLHTAHGRGSDEDHNGYADRFSNAKGSNQTSLGAYLTGGTYSGEHGLSLYLDGLSSTNSRARSRAIVIHGASYVDPSLSKMGRSLGCPALPLAQTSRVIRLIKGKSLLFAWAG